VGGVSCAFDSAVDDDLRCVDILPLHRSSVFPLSLVEGWVADGGGSVEVVPVGYGVGWEEEGGGGRGFGGLWGGRRSRIGIGRVRGLLGGWVMGGEGVDGGWEKGGGGISLWDGGERRGY